MTEARTETEKVTFCPSHDETKFGISIDDQVFVEPEHFRLDDSSVKMTFDALNSRRGDDFVNIHIRLIGDEIVDSLRFVHLNLNIEGTIIEVKLEAERNLTHIFTWNGKDCYGRRTAGKSELLVKAGYDYYDCEGIVWSQAEFVIIGSHGFETSVMGWNIELHHRLDPASRYSAPRFNGQPA